MRGCIFDNDPYDIVLGRQKRRNCCQVEGGYKECESEKRFHGLKDAYDVKLGMTLTNEQMFFEVNLTFAFVIVTSSFLRTAWLNTLPLFFLIQASAAIS